MERLYDYKSNDSQNDFVATWNTNTKEQCDKVLAVKWSGLSENPSKTVVVDKSYYYLQLSILLHLVSLQINCSLGWYM